MTRHPIVEEDLAIIAAEPLNWRRFSGKTILISGANGFLPAYLVETLLYLNDIKMGEKPLRVIGVVRNGERARARFAHYAGRRDLEIIVQDISALEHVDGPVDFIVHCASQASPKFYSVDPVGTITPNVLGTQNLLQLAKRKQSESFLFLSSGEVYGHVDSEQQPIQEGNFGYTDLSDVRSCYAEAKRLGEVLCVAWQHQHQTPAKVVRPFHTYGPGMRLDDGRVFADFVADIVNRRDIVMNSDGLALRAFCYLRDAIIAYFLVLLEGKDGAAYNVGNEHAETRVVELADMLAELFADRGVKVIRKKPVEGYLQSPLQRNCPDTRKMRALGWKPQVGLAEGFARTVQSFL